MKASKVEDFAMAMARLVCKYPPEKFNVAYFSILVMSGRVEEATEYVKNFTEAKE